MVQKVEFAPSCDAGRASSDPFKFLFSLLGIAKSPDASSGLFMAQKEGFEPSRRFTQPTPLAGEPLRPLGYFCKTGS